MSQNNQTLDAVLAALQPISNDTEYVFVTSPQPLTQVIPTAMIREGTEGLETFSYVLDVETARAAGISGEFRCRRIDPGIDTNLAGVGIMAQLAGALAREDIPMNPIAGYFRDHLFVPVERTNDALEALRGVARRARLTLEVLEFWFGALTSGFAADAARDRWFGGGPVFDRLIAERFGDALVDAAAGKLCAMTETPHGRLAFILITDQFSRQIHRGTAQAFATDPLALAAAHTGIQRGDDRILAFDERTFFYLPFEHAEGLADQNVAVTMFTQLCDATPADNRHLTADTLRYAQAHRDIIARFGRFPHRNAVLGRTSTAAEMEFLASASHFGQ